MLNKQEKSEYYCNSGDIIKYILLKLKLNYYDENINDLFNNRLRI